MNPRHVKLLRNSWLLVAGLISLPAAVHAQKQFTDNELIASLKKGGHVIFIRHATTDVSKTDQNREDLSDWNKQRNLSDTGRREAVAIGLAFRAMAIPVGDILASPYCRCIETGKLAFGKAQISKELAFSVAEDKKNAELLAKSLKAMLGTKPAGQANTILSIPLGQSPRRRQSISQARRRNNDIQAAGE